MRGQGWRRKKELCFLSLFQRLQSEVSQNDHWLVERLSAGSGDQVKRQKNRMTCCIIAAVTVSTETKTYFTFNINEVYDHVSKRFKHFVVNVFLSAKIYYNHQVDIMDKFQSKDVCSHFPASFLFVHKSIAKRIFTVFLVVISAWVRSNLWECIEWGSEQHLSNQNGGLGWFEDKRWWDYQVVKRK